MRRREKESDIKMIQMRKYKKGREGGRKEEREGRNKEKERKK